MDKTDARKIFKNGSTTYFYSSIFFPSQMKEEVFTLYAFVRKADDFVDSVPQQKKAFLNFRKQYSQALAGKTVTDPIITQFVQLMRRRAFEPSWVNSFLDCMEADLSKKTYATIKETEKYMYGSAEVIGLMMCAIMQLPKEAYPAAKMLGRAMQFINFIRDVQEDNSLGRTYLPAADLQKFHLTGLQEKETTTAPEKFAQFIHFEIDRYKRWQKEAEAGFHFIPKRYRVPIQTASNMYLWTAQQIARDPMIIYQKKVKPLKIQIVAEIIKNYLTI